MPRNGIAELNGSKSMFSFITNNCTVFKSDGTILHSHQQQMRIPSTLYSFFYCFSVRVVSIFLWCSPLSHPHSLPCSHSQSPPCCPCVWVVYILPAPFPSGPCQSVPCFHTSGSICSFVCSVH